MKWHRLALAGALSLVLLGVSIARGQDAPPSPAGSAPAGSTPARTAPDAKGTPAAAEAPEREGLTFGSKPDELIDAALDLFLADFKSRSHFGFRELQGSRNGEVAFVKDLGWPSSVLVPGVRLTLDLGKLGFVSEELQALDVEDATGTIERERFTNQITFEPGDRMHSHGAVVWSNFVYGYELRYRLLASEGVPIDVSMAPTIAFGLIDLDVRLRRQSPSPTPSVGGHQTAWTFAPGGRAGIEVMDHFLAGADLTWLPGPFGISSPRLRLYERVRGFVGVRFFHLEATVGYRMQANHIQGDARGSDMRLRGFDFSLGVNF